MFCEKILPNGQIINISNNKTKITQLEFDDEFLECLDGCYYTKEYAYIKNKEILAERLRRKRNMILKSTDVYMLPDFPITEEQREYIIEYRQYLRDITKSEQFPNIGIKDFVLP